MWLVNFRAVLTVSNLKVAAWFQPELNRKISSISISARPINFREITTEYFINLVSSVCTVWYGPIEFFPQWLRNAHKTIFFTWHTYILSNIPISWSRVQTENTQSVLSSVKFLFSFSPQCTVMYDDETKPQQQIASFRSTSREVSGQIII